MDLIFKFLFCLFFVNLAFFNEVLDYGPFSLKITNIEMCKGPKRKDCSMSSVKLWSVNETILHSRTVIKKNLNKVQVKILGSLDRSATALQRIHIKSVCDNFGIKMVFDSLLKLNDNCDVLKGTYENTLDLKSLAQNYFGGKFIYGNYTFKNYFYTDRCNHLCVVIKMIYYPVKRS